MTETLDDVTARKKNRSLRRRPPLRPSWCGWPRNRALSLTGPDGLLKQLTKAVLQTALNEEMTEHLGYGKHDPAGAGSGNVRNGNRSKTVLTDATGHVQPDRPWPGTMGDALETGTERLLDHLRRPGW